MNDGNTQIMLRMTDVAEDSGSSSSSSSSSHEPCHDNDAISSSSAPSPQDSSTTTTTGSSSCNSSTTAGRGSYDFSNVNNVSVVVTFDLSRNQYYNRKGRWLNKPALYYTHGQLKEMRAEAVAIAKSLEDDKETDETDSGKAGGPVEESHSPSQLRGLEGVAPTLLQQKVERRKRARAVVLGTLEPPQDDTENDSKPNKQEDKVAIRYGQACQEAVAIALQVAQQDAREVHLEQEKEAILQKQQQEEAPLTVVSPLTINDTSLLSVFDVSQLSPPPKEPLRVTTSSLHTELSLSTSSSDSDCDSEQCLHTGTTPPVAALSKIKQPPGLQLKQAVSSIRRRFLLRRSTTTTTSQ